MSGANGAGDRTQDPPPPGAMGTANRTTAADEDSGLIDIKNMAHTTKRRVTERHSTASDVEESLLASSRPSALRDVVLPEPGEEQPMTLATPAVAAEADAAAAQPKRTPWLAAAAALVLLAGGAVAFFALRGGGEGDDGVRVAASEAPADRGAAATPSMPGADEPPAEPSEPGAIAEDGDETAAADDEGAETSDDTAADEGDTAAGDEPTGDAVARDTASKRDRGSKAGSAKSTGAVASRSSSSDDKAARSKADTAKKADDSKSEAKPKGQDLDSLLDFAAGESGKKKGVADKKAPERKAPTKTKLSRTDVQKGMRAVTARVGACYEQFKVPGTVKVRVTIANTGVITEAKATGSFANTDTGACVAKAVSQASFPEYDGPPMSLTYPFLLQ